MVFWSMMLEQSWTTGRESVEKKKAGRSWDFHVFSYGCAVDYSLLNTCIVASSENGYLKWSYTVYNGKLLFSTI